VPLLLAAKAKKTLRAPVAPLVLAGDALIFDYRVLHRGKANASLWTNRPILVLTYSQPWFRDLLNFPKRSIFHADTNHDNHHQTKDDDDDEDNDSNNKDETLRLKEEVCNGNN
jgi:hypothetical protein